MTQLDDDQATSPIDSQLDALFAAAATPVAPNPALVAQVLARVRERERARTRVLGVAVGIGLSIMALSMVAFSGRWSAIMSAAAQSRPGLRLLDWLGQGGAAAFEPTTLLTLATPLALLLLWPLLSGSRTA